MPPPARRPPLPFGRYLLLDRIAIGGMAEVWRAREYAPGVPERVVVVKRLLPHAAEEEELVTLFHAEARVSERAAHPNVVRVFAHGRQAGIHFLAMEYVPGRDAQALLERTRERGRALPVPLACHLAAELCEGLHHVHSLTDEAGRPLRVVHRDVSPRNVLLAFDGAVKLTDFGIAKSAESAVVTRGGVLRGRLGYLSPERVEGRAVDHRSDLFSAGVVLYELLTGERLFPAEDSAGVLERVRQASVPPPSSLNPAVPAALDALVLRTLSRAPDARPPDAAALARALRAFCPGGGAPAAGQAALGALLREAFAGEVAEEAARARQEAELTLPPELLAGLLRSAGAAPAPPPPGGEDGGRAARSPRRRLVQGGLLAAAALGLLVGGMGLLSRARPTGELRVALPAALQGRARVWVEGREVALTPAGADGVRVVGRVPAGRVRVRVVAEGFAPFERLVTVGQKGAELAVEARPLAPALSRD
jgi:hypothetical protein